MFVRHDLHTLLNALIRLDGDHIGGHYFGNERTVGVAVFQNHFSGVIPLREDSREHPSVDNQYSPDVFFGHEPECIQYGMIRGNGKQRIDRFALEYMSDIHCRKDLVVGENTKKEERVKGKERKGLKKTKI